MSSIIGKESLKMEIESAVPEPASTLRIASVLVNGIPAGTLQELENGWYRFVYLAGYTGPSVAITMPVSKKVWDFRGFPPFFEGLLPEGEMLEGLLKQEKIDRSDLFSQLIAVGMDMVGAVTVERAL